MDIDKECSALGGLFQKIINDMKTSSPVWEDFLLKATKLHTALRGTITAAGAFLETFQKVADAATNTQGATREIGSALTRLCMRHRSIESKLKEFTQSIMELMVTPMQDKMDDWKKTSVHLDKEHAKEYKKARQEIKRASSDTMRLQKKVKKDNTAGKHDMQLRLDHAMQDVNDKYLLLEEAEKSSVRTALIEERGRFCMFVSCLKPVVDQEIAMLTEVTHLQEIVEQLCMIAGDPTQLPEASEQLLQDVKTTEGTSFTFQTPPSSPSSLGSRKSSMCSINSINSSSSGSSKSHSPCHQLRHHRNSAQALTPGAIRLSSVSSQDSGFTSQDTLYPRPHTPQPTTNRQSSLVETSNTSLASSTSSGVNQSASATDITSANSSEGINNANNNTDTANTSLSGTWASWTASTDLGGLERPHTISTAYERSHARPALTAHTFEAPPPTTSQTAPATPNPYAVPCLVPEGNKSDPNVSSKPTSKIYERSASVGAAPSTPTTAKKARSVVATPVVAPTVPDFIMTHQDQSKKANVIPQPVYVNMNELATMAAQKHKEVEMRRKQGVALPQGSPNMGGAEQRPPDGRASIAGIPGSPATVAAQQLAQRNQRSMSMPAAPEDMSPLSEALEGLNSEMKSGQHIIQSKYQAPNSMELAAAIKDLEASTAALQMTYENKPPNNEDECDDDEENEDGSLRRSSMHKPSPPVRRNSSLGGMMPSSALIQAAASIQPTNPPRSGSNTPTPQPSPSSTPRAQHPTQGQQNVAPGQQSPVPGQMGGVINLNSLMQQQNEVIYMQPHFHLQQQQQQQQSPTTAQHYQATSTAPGSHYQAAQPQYQHPNQQPNQQTQHYHPGQPHYQAAQPNNHQPQQQQHYHTGQQQQIPQSGYQQQHQQQQTIYQQSTINNPHPYHPPQQNGTSEPPPAPAPAPGPQEDVGGGFWPPPPPPVQESDYAELDTIQMQIHDVSSGSQRPSSIGHIQSTHGSIIQSLNAKLSAAPNHIPGAPANMNNGNNDCGVYGGNQTNMMNSTLSYSSDDVTPTAEPPRDAIMHQHIKQ